jgi:hypothetical protein
LDLGVGEHLARRHAATARCVIFSCLDFIVSHNDGNDARRDVANPRRQREFARAGEEGVQTVWACIRVGTPASVCWHRLPLLVARRPSVSSREGKGMVYDNRI